MNDIPKEIRDWVEEIIQKNLEAATSEGARAKVEYKKWHIGEVVRIGREIVENTPEIKWNVAQAMAICLLHDIGRFPQVLANSFSDIKTGIDHASLGVKMIAEKSFPWEKWDMKESEIMEAIKWHNQKDYLGDNLYAKFIRDADKNALFLDFEEMEKVAHTEKIVGKEISENVWKTLEEHKTIGNENVTTFAEDIVNKATWLWNLNIKYSRTMSIRSGVIEKIILALKNNGNSEEEIERLRKNLEEFRLFATAV